MVRNYEKQIENLEEVIDDEKNKVTLLEKENEKMKSELAAMDNSNSQYKTLLREKEAALETIQVSNKEKDQQLNFQLSVVSNLEAKYKELLETNEALDEEACIIPSLKKMIEQLTDKIAELEKRLEDEENKSREMLSSLEAVQIEKSFFEQKAEEEVASFKELHEKYKNILELKERLSKENDELQMELKRLNLNFSEIEADREKLLLLCEEKSEMIDTIKKDSEEKLASEMNKLTQVTSDYEQLLNKLKTTESCLSENSKFSAELEEKICEVENLKTDLSKTKDDLKHQCDSTYEVLRLLQDTEEKYNKDRIELHTEILNYKDQIEKLDFKTRMLKVDVEDLEKLKPENEKLKEHLEKLNLEISEHILKEEELSNEIKAYDKKCLEMERSKIRKEEELSNEIKAYSKKCLEMERSKALEEEKLAEKRDVFLSNDCNKKEPATKLCNMISMTPLHQSTPVKTPVADSDGQSDVSIIEIRHVQQSMEKKTTYSSQKWDMESSGSECLELVQDERTKIPDKKIEAKPKARDLDSSGSECMELIYNERTKIPDKKIEARPKARDMDSSGSECMELVYDEKFHKAVGLSRSTPKKSAFSKNNMPATPMDKPKLLLPFKTKRKRDDQKMTQEDIVRKKFGLPPRKKLDAVKESPSLQPQMSRPGSFLNQKARATVLGSTTPLQRKFFTKRADERETPKTTPKLWF